MKTSVKRHIVLVLLFILLFIIIMKCAWIMDDAYISFRYAKNFLHGHGLRWNISERVQAYTNPLYLFATIPLFAITQDIYLSSIILSVSLTMLAALWILYPTGKKNLWIFAFSIVLLTTSKAFIDFSTSGLENSFTYLLLALFYREFLTKEQAWEGKTFLKLCFIASLALINRMDSILLMLPALGYCFFVKFKPKKILYGFIGFVPFIVWEAFSLIYYGFFIPNTAYAKLNIATETIRMIKDGWRYILVTNKFGDNITLVAIFASIVLGVIFMKRAQRKYLITASSIVLYLLYIIKVGGDFMVGRFLAAPLFLAIILINYSLLEYFKEKSLDKKMTILVLATTLMVGCISPASPITSHVSYHRTTDYILPQRNVSDARKAYFADGSLVYYVLNNVRQGYDAERPIHDWGREGVTMDPNEVYIKSGIGFIGYFCPEETFIIDRLALADPLLSRITAPPNQRIAHYQRGIPKGYYDTVSSGKNVIDHPSLHAYYDKLKLIVSGDIFDPERLKTIWEFNMGKYDYLMDDYINSEEYEATLQYIY